MHRFRKNPSSSITLENGPPSTPTSHMVGYINQQLETSQPPTKDQRALVASSSAVALSITSPSCDPTGIMLNGPGSFEESDWRTSYGAAKMAVEIANASSDMFLPLKAVVGALSVLAKNYDVSNSRVSSQPSLIMSCSGPPMQHLSEPLSTGYCHFVRYSYPQWMIKTAKKRHGERFLGGLYFLLSQPLAYVSLRYIHCSQQVGWNYYESQIAF